MKAYNGMASGQLVRWSMKSTVTPNTVSTERDRRSGEEMRVWEYIALSGKVVIILTNQPDEPSSLGRLGSEDASRQWQEVMRLADVAYDYAANAHVHMKLLQEALEELWQ